MLSCDKQYWKSQIEPQNFNSTCNTFLGKLYITRMNKFKRTEFILSNLTTYNKMRNQQKCTVRRETTEAYRLYNPLPFVMTLVVMWPLCTLGEQFAMQNPLITHKSHQHSFRSPRNGHFLIYASWNGNYHSPWLRSLIFCQYLLNSSGWNC